MRCDSWASLLTHTLASLCFGCKPKAKVMTKGVMFQDRATSGNIIQFIPFDYAFYAFEFPLFNNHDSYEGDVIIIPFSMGTQQGDRFKRALFVLNHFRALCFITNCFPSCLFLSIANYTHIIGPLSIVLFVYEHV
jgi:hypothetical protein